MDMLIKRSRKVLIGIVGGLIVLIGLILVPYPGPGWLIVFAGLAILGTEFRFARRMRTFARHKYDDWSGWLRRQPWYIQLLALAATGMVVLVTLWLLNTFSLLAGWLGIEQYSWLVSPFFR